MGWIGVITNVGNDMLAQLSGGGHTMTITGMTAGTGTVAEANLRTQTSVSGEVGTGSIVKKEDITGGVLLRLRLGASSGSAYVAKQIGLWAKIDSGTEQLLSLHQDAVDGVSVPTSADSPEFAFDFIVTIAMSNTGSLTVTIDSSVYATEEDLDDLGALKADKSDTVLLTTLSRGRKSGTTVGTGSFAFGNDTTAVGQYSHAEGMETEVNYVGEGGHAEGYKSKVSNAYGHAEGYNTTASGHSAHAEGKQTKASSDGCHAEGVGSEASAYAGHAEGDNTKASGFYSHAEGFRTEAKGEYSHVSGRWNVVDNDNKFAEIVGNGEFQSGLGPKSNARALDWDGNELIAGNMFLKAGASSTGGEPVPAACDVAISAVGNTHAAISAGQYVRVTNHSTLADGLYIANSAIAENANLTSSNLTAVSGGGLNDLAGKCIASAAKDFGNISSLSDLKTAIETKAAAMSANEVAPVRFYAGTLLGDPFNTAAYIGYLYCNYNNGTRVDLSAIFTSGNGDAIEVARLNGTWSVNGIAFKSDIPAVIDNLTSTSATSALSANQGKALNDNYAEKWATNYGSSQTPVTDLSALPLNGGGYCTLSASLSPSGTVSAWVFDKRGTANRYIVKISRVSSTAQAGQTYVGSMYDGTFGGWELLIRDSSASHMEKTDWDTSLVVNNSHALVLISQVYRVVVWLSSTAGIDISVACYTASGLTGYRKHSDSNTLTFGASSTDTTFTVTRNNDYKFTIKSTDNETNHSWKALY